MSQPNNGFSYKTIQCEQIYENFSQEIIVTTSDKLTILLGEHVKYIESRNYWQTPLAIFITIVLVLTTTNFKESFGLSSDVWNAIFIISGVVSFFWTIVSLYQRKNNISVATLINKIKNAQTEIDPST